MRLRASRARAAPVLVQQPDGRLPALRRPGRDRVLRPQARRRASEFIAGERRDPRLGPQEPLLLLDAAVARLALRLRRRAAVGAARRKSAGADPLGFRAGEDRLHLSERARPQHRQGARLRRRDPQPRAPLPRNRLERGARGAGQAPQHARLPGMRRHAAAARSPACQDFGQDSVRGVGLASAENPRLLQEPATRRGARASGRAHRARDRQPPRVPGQRRARLPGARALRRDAVGRRGAAHTAREPDRLRPHRGHVRARRALDRPAPARQCAPDRDAEAPARPRQLGDRGRARRGRDPRRRPRRRHGAGRGRGRRAHRRGRPSFGNHFKSPVAHRALSGRRADHRGAAAAQPAELQSPGRARRDRQQPEGHRSRAAARAAGVRDWCFGLGQIHAHQRHALCGGRAQPLRQRRRAGAARFDRRPGAPRQGDQRRPEPDRPHAALQPCNLYGIVHADAGIVRERA